VAEDESGDLGGNTMAGRLRHVEYSLRIHPNLLHNARHFARLHEETLSKWLNEAIISKLEDEIDAAAALESMSDTEGALFWEDYLKLVKEKSKTDPKRSQ
jgi:hypothetical protein